MRLFSHILNTRTQFGNKILQEKTQLRFNKIHRISLTEFESINWLHTNKNVHHCINARAIRLVNSSNCPFYLMKSLSSPGTVQKTLEILKRTLRRTNTERKLIVHWSLFGWFFDDKLTIHFGRVKTKSIHFPRKRRTKSIRELNIRHREINMKQQA